MSSVVVTGLKKVDSMLTYPIHEPMFLSDPPRPAARQYELQRLRFADADERIFHNSFNQFQDSKCCSAVRFYPKSQVLSKVRMENGLSLNGP
jgi:hypothetical protein